MNHIRIVKALACGILIAMITACSFDDVITGYIPEMDIYFLEKRSFLVNTLGEHPRARLYISKTDSFGSDYIEFRYSELSQPKIYYIPEEGFYVADSDSTYKIRICQEQFDIHYINIKRLYPRDSLSSEFTRYYYDEDTIKAQEAIYMAKPHYTIGFYTYADGIYVDNPKGETIYKTK